jgi:hypothetical protein
MLFFSLIFWGFFGHQLINQYAVYILPPEMMVIYKPNIAFITEHAVDPDKRRYAVKEEGPRHYIDMDHFHPWDSIPKTYTKAVEKYGEDTLNRHGIGPWWLQQMSYRLTKAFEEKELFKIIKLSAEIGHYMADLHVPLHTSSNHNGQKTNQYGIHGFWESRVPELFANQEYDFVVGKAIYIKNVQNYVWTVVIQSAAASDSVLQIEKELTAKIRPDYKYSFENRNGITVKQYSSYFSMQYQDKLNGMVERRMRESIHATASIWYTAWVNAGQPDLQLLVGKTFTEEELQEWNTLNIDWKSADIKGRSCEN